MKRTQTQEQIIPGQKIERQQSRRTWITRERERLDMFRKISNYFTMSNKGE